MLQNCHYTLIFWLLFFVSIHKKILALVLFSANLRKRVFFLFFCLFFFSVSMDRKVSASVLILKVVFLKKFFGIYFPFFLFF